MPRTRSRRGGFFTGKTFGDWEEFASFLARPIQDALKTLERVARRENLSICGSSGTGEFYFCEALGHAAIEAGMSVAWHAIEDLGVLVRRHRVDDSMAKAVTRLMLSALIVIDDIRPLPVSTDAAEGVYRLVEAAYERRSLVVPSNLHPSGFDESMPETLSTSMVDRPLRHAHVAVHQSDGFRLAQATPGEGVKVLT